VHYSTARAGRKLEVMPRPSKEKPTDRSAGVSERTMRSTELVLVDSIRVIRGRRVILDADLAALYGVPTKRMNEQLKRNAHRFPPDFVFRLTAEETDTVNRSQNATGSQRHRDPRLPPLAFTEHGAIMAATILNSAAAVQMSVYVVRAFVRLRHAAVTSAVTAEKLRDLESRLTRHDEDIASIMAAIRELMAPVERPRKGIGFLADID
jgi:hypothetical protein